MMILWSRPRDPSGRPLVINRDQTDILGISFLSFVFWAVPIHVDGVADVW